MIKPHPLSKYKNFLSYNFEKYLNDFPTLNESYQDFYNEYFHFHFIHPYKVCDTRTYKNYQKGLYESLKTHNIEEFAAKLEKQVGTSLSDMFIDYEGETPIMDVLFVYLYDLSKLKDIKQLCILYGYYIAKQYKEGTRYILIIETTYGYTDKTDYVYNECNGILYHITANKYVPKILKIGLAPKHLNKQCFHPARIYFSGSDASKKSLINLGKQLHPNGNFTILKIDLSKMPKKTKLKFYMDPAYAKVGVFTCENISPNCTSIEETF